jgi:hypothetical protein
LLIIDYQIVKAIRLNITLYSFQYLVEFRMKVGKKQLAVGKIFPSIKAVI